MSEQTQLYYEENLRVLDAAVSRYEEWYQAAPWPFSWTNPKPETMRADWLKKMIQAGQLPRDAGDPGGLDWSVKLALASGSVVVLIVVVLWAIGKAGK